MEGRLGKLSAYGGLRLYLAGVHAGGDLSVDFCPDVLEINLR